MELISFRHIALGDVGVDDVNFSDFSFDESWSVVRFIVETYLDVFEFMFAENRDAVIAFLSLEDKLIAGISECIGGEVLVLNFCFL